MSESPRQLPPKKEVALALLEGPSMFVHLDPRQKGVVVPKWFLGKPQLVLQLGLNMAIPIPDLRVEDEGISCTLSFNRAPFWCRLPWEAVYALVGEDGRGMVWPQDVPPEVALQMQKGAAQAGKPAKKQRKLASVDGGGDGGGAGGGDDAPVRAGARSRSRAEADRARADGKATTTPIAVPSLASDDEEMGDKARPAASPAGPPRKPRRELPPYLRVIK
jgi:hypothetical protein